MTETKENRKRYNDLTIEDIERSAKLVRIHITEKEKETYRKRLSGVLDCTATLREIDTNHVKELFHPADLKNIFRKDEIRKSLTSGKALRNASRKKEGYFRTGAIFLQKI